MSRRHDRAASDRERLNRVQDIAERSAVSTRQVRRWIKNGVLVAHRLGRCLRVAESDYLAFLARCRKGKP